MIDALLDNRMIQFYSIYEKFDQMGVFESKWEKELIKSLENINDNITKVIDSINRLDVNLRISILELGANLSFDIASASASIEKRLASIGSDIKFNNLLTAVSVYQQISK